MSILLATLCLNEMEWLPRLYTQHGDWPGLAKWVFIEATDRMYAEANPDMVGPEGLSIDGTSSWLKELATKDERVLYVPHGFTEHADPAAGKCAARQRYLDVAEEVGPEFVIVLDADEFYTRADQGRLLEIMRSSTHSGFTFPRREIWQPPSIADQPLFQYEVRGGFWDIPCCHWWRWSPGLHYSGNHNTPEDVRGVPLTRYLTKLHHDLSMPQMVHLGFASAKPTRLAKNAYYAARGEGRTDRRGWYVESRAAWEHWRLGGDLPRGAEVVAYNGPVPEVFRD